MPIWITALIQKVLTKFLPFQRCRKPVYSNNFAGSAAFAEVYALRVMSFSIFRYFRKCRDIVGGRCRWCTRRQVTWIHLCSTSSTQQGRQQISTAPTRTRYVRPSSTRSSTVCATPTSIFVFPPCLYLQLAQVGYMRFRNRARCRGRPSGEFRSNGDVTGLPQSRRTKKKSPKR